jgi:DNA (cytosine-5)-methyltransferase 1
VRVGSLFTGYGGLDMAVINTFGGEVAWYSEIDKAACQVLAVDYPEIENLGDITKVDWSAVAPVDILTGGYPCQPFSAAGNRKGKNDERHLWPYVCSAVNALRPRLVVLENVRGHLTLGFGDVLADISRMGYDARWGLVRASDAGAPHGRARIFIVAEPANAYSA